MKRALVTTVATTAAAPTPTRKRLEDDAHAIMRLTTEPAHYIGARALDTFLFKGNSTSDRYAVTRRKRGRGPTSHAGQLAKQRAKNSKNKLARALALVEDASERAQLETFAAANTLSSMLQLLGDAQQHSDGEDDGVDAADGVDGAATNHDLDGGDADIDGGEFGGGTGTTDAAWGTTVQLPLATADGGGGSSSSSSGQSSKAALSPEQRAGLKRQLPLATADGGESNPFDALSEQKLSAYEQQRASNREHAKGRSV